MSLQAYKLTDAEVRAKGVIAAPDRLTGTAAENKALFDRLVRDDVKEKYNALIDALDGRGVYNVILNDLSDGAKYALIARGGKLTLVCVSTETPADEPAIADVETGKTYLLTVNGGRLVLREE